jgi:hypothetical protein
MTRFSLALLGLLALAGATTAADVQPEAQLRFYQRQFENTAPAPPPAKYETPVLLGKIPALDGWEFQFIAPGAFAIYSPEGHCNQIVGDPVFVYQHGPDKQVSGKTYGMFRRAVERIDLGKGLHLIVITVGEGRQEGRGYADEAVFISEHGVLAVQNLYSNEGKATAYRYSYPDFFYRSLVGRLGPELASETQYKEWLYFDGSHVTDYEGRFPRGEPSGKRAAQAAEYDRNPPTIDFVSADRAFARRLGITTDDLRFISLWRQAQAAAANDSDSAAQKLGQEYLAKAREQGKDRMVALEKAIREQKAPVVVTLVAVIVHAPGSSEGVG